MHIHILGICGTFMGGIAAIAKELGHQVSGSDLNVYPPMSTQLQQLGIELTQGWHTSQFDPEPDVVIIGNALSRGNEAVEYVLNRNLNYTSGPEWLKQNVLKERWVIAASGTHGKTTTASMITWLLADSGLNPGYLIGGVPGNFDVSATAGSSPFFVIEADEYDTAFFDKRSKFVHYLPKTLVFNNLEFDHADIFSDLAAIQTQFHHLIRTVPSNGLIIAPNATPSIEQTLARGCWTPVDRISLQPNADCKWQAELIANAEGLYDGTQFNVILDGKNRGKVCWQLTGKHNVHNGLMALAAAQHAGVPIEQLINSLSEFKTPKRRMELIYDDHNITVYDDFAHHPTAIATTLEGLRSKVGNDRIIAILEPRSNTMKMGVHKDTLAGSWQEADKVCLYQGQTFDWQINTPTKGTNLTVYQNIERLVAEVVENVQAGDHIVIMSNGGFAGIHQKLINAIKNKFNC